MNSDLETIFLTKKDFQKSFNNNDYWKTKSLHPISKNKARWILSNPRLNDDDYCVLLGYEKKALVALIYLIPDLIQTKANNQEKVYWLVLWWVDDSYKNTVLGAYMYTEAMKLCNNKVLVKGYANNADLFYSKQPYTSLISSDNQTIFFGVETSFLTAKFTFLKPFTPIISLFGNILNYFIFSLNKLKNKKRTKEFNYEYLNELDDETWTFLSSQLHDDIIYKTRDYINWQLDQKQYIQTVIQKKVHNKVVVQGFGSHVCMHTFKVIIKDEIIGFISFLQFNNEAYIKYFICDNDNYDQLIDALMEHLIILKIKVLYIYDSAAVQKLNNKYIKVFNYTRKSKAIIHKSIADNVISLNIKNRDGHFI